MLLTYDDLFAHTQVNELLYAQDDGQVVPINEALINASSIDITLGENIFVEAYDNNVDQQIIDLSEGKFMDMDKISIKNSPYLLEPGDFILAESEQYFNLPNSIAGLYVLKSTLARNGLNHLNAGWCDPGFHDSKLTLELQNVTKYHTWRLRCGMKIGQIFFLKGKLVPQDKSYAKKGQYNKLDSVAQGKQLR